MVKVRDDLPKTQEGIIDLTEWVARVSQKRSYAGRAIIQKASELCFAYGEDKLTELGESSFKQALVTAEILSHLDPDAETLAAGLLYFPFYYGNLSLVEIEKQLSPEIAALVEGVAKIHITESRLRAPTDFLSATQQRDNLRRMLLAVVEDVRVVLIKLAERITALRTAAKCDIAIRQKLAIETRDIYAPLANRLGIGQIKWELEDFTFRYLEPEAYKQIATLLDEKRIDREEYIEAVIRLLKNTLEKEGVKCEVVGRAKHIYSIWRKMSRKDIDFKDIYDVRALRVVVNKISDCYAALGVVHTLWQPIPHEFDDYIAMPKSNGYRSLHTAVMGPDGKSLEVQIRTYEMHQESELGVAAHWLYKEGKEGAKRDAIYQRKIMTLRQILEWEQQGSDESPDELLSTEFFDDRVYVFTPHGDVVDLPKGATPLDFAYYVHTDIGHRCRGAKINGQMVPLNRVLQSGDQLEILTTKHGGPSRDWANPSLGYLVSTRARAKILTWFKKQDRDKNKDEGRIILEKELKKLGLVESAQSLLKAGNQLNYKTLDDVYAAFGAGDIRLSQILNILHPPPVNAVKSASTSVKHKQHARSEITIEGIGDLMFHYALCCKPVAGDDIVGYITLGRGVTIHRQDCLNVLHLPEDYDNRLIQVHWGDTQLAVYAVDIEIKAYDRQGLFKDITSILTAERVNIIKVNMTTDKSTNIDRFLLTIEIRDLPTLGKVVNRLLQLPNVLEAHRIQ